MVCGAPKEMLFGSNSASIGGRCGAIWVQHQFLHTFLRQKLSRNDFENIMEIGNDVKLSGGHSMVGRYEKVLLEAFEGVFHPFDGVDEGIPEVIELPEDLGVDDDPANGISHGRISITVYVSRLMFGHCVTC
jgi:hypothetical protein